MQSFLGAPLVLAAGPRKKKNHKKEPWKKDELGLKIAPDIKPKLEERKDLIPDASYFPSVIHRICAANLCVSFMNHFKNNNFIEKLLCS